MRPKRFATGRSTMTRAIERIAFTPDGRLLVLSNAQDLWIGSGRTRGGRTFPNDPVMVTE